MGKCLLFIFFLTMEACFISGATADASWTDKKLERVIAKAEKAARKKKWSRAIKYSDQAIAGSVVLDGPEAPRYIEQLTHRNLHYIRAGRLQEVSAELAHTYKLAKAHLGLYHEATLISRTLYYNYLIDEKEYGEAIPLVLHGITVVNNTDDSEKNSKKLVYLKKLFSLYGLTEQYEQEEEVLWQYLTLNEILFGKDDISVQETIVNLARNYCRRKKLLAFNNLVKQYDLKYACE